MTRMTRMTRKGCSDSVVEVEGSAAEGDEGETVAGVDLVHDLPGEREKRERGREGERERERVSERDFEIESGRMSVRAQRRKGNIGIEEAGTRVRRWDRRIAT